MRARVARQSPPSPQRNPKLNKMCCFLRYREKRWKSSTILHLKHLKKATTTTKKAQGEAISSSLTHRVGKLELMRTTISQIRITTFTIFITLGITIVKWPVFRYERWINCFWYIINIYRLCLYKIRYLNSYIASVITHHAEIKGSKCNMLSPSPTVPCPSWDRLRDSTWCSQVKTHPLGNPAFVPVNTLLSTRCRLDSVHLVKV